MAAVVAILTYPKGFGLYIAGKVIIRFSITDNFFSNLLVINKFLAVN